jgi:hypothetical protein
LRLLSPDNLRAFRHDRIHGLVVRLIDLFDHIQRGMNHGADPRQWKHCINTDLDLCEIRERLVKLGATLDYPFQHYKRQCLSGHIFYPDAHQLHIRVFPLKKGYGLKAHYEWNAEFHPLRHLACKDLSYPEGARMLRRLWAATG